MQRDHRSSKFAAILLSLTKKQKQNSSDDMFLFGAAAHGYLFFEESY